MDDGHLIKPSVLKSLKKNKHLKLKQILGDGQFTQGILLDVHPNQEAIGKIVSVQNEGEFTLWPDLRHESLIPLLEIVAIDERKWLFVCPYLKISLGSLIEEVSFIQHPKCFDRKKSYVRDVLSGLEYLHQLSLSSLNLSDQNVLICSRSDRALISDFSLCVSVKRATKFELPVDKIKFLPPELRQLEDSGDFECMPIDMWLCGIMALQIFTGHALPTIEDSEDILRGFTTELLLNANTGSYLAEDSATCLREFLEPFLRQDPRKRIGAKEAIELHFLRSSARRLDEQARRFWETKDAFELISTANKIQVPQRTCGLKSNVHTICDGSKFELEERVKALKTLCSEKLSYRKAKSELEVEKSGQLVEGKIQIQPHNSITVINCLYESDKDAVPENSIEPHLFNDFITLPRTASFANFDSFPCDYHNEDVSLSTISKFNFRLEKDPWKENDESHLSSDSITKTEASFPNSITSIIPEDKYFVSISNSPGIPQDGAQETSPIKQPLAAYPTCEQFHQAMLTADNDHRNTNENVREPCANNPKRDNVMKKGSFSNVSWKHEEGCVEGKSMVPRLRRRNACRYKMGTKLLMRNQTGRGSVSQHVPESMSPPNLRDAQDTSLSSPIKEQLTANQASEEFPQETLASNGQRDMKRSVPQHVPELIPSTNLRDIYVHDQMDETAFSYLLDEMYCYNLRRPADKRIKKQSQRVGRAKCDQLLQGILSRKADSGNYEVEISSDLPLCSNIDCINGIKAVEKTLPKKKPAHRFLRMLCPGSKTETKFNKGFNGA